MRRLGSVLALFFISACGPTAPGNGGNGNGGGADGGGGGNWPDANWQPPGEFADAAPVQACDKMDILFVVDNSGSMGQEQTNLADNFPQFIQVLDNYDPPLDYRVGITTTGIDYTYTMDLGGFTLPQSQTGGDNGALLQRCDMTRRWVEGGDSNRSATFSCAAEVGADGPADEMPLAAVHKTFADRMADGTNAGFHRDDALLAIVILTDEDDCSYEQSVTLGLGQTLCTDQMEAVDTYKNFLDQYTGGAGRWAVAVIAGVTDCSSDFGGAQEAKRLKQFASMAGTNGVVSSICEADLSIGLQDALDTFDSACQGFPPID